MLRLNPRPRIPLLLGLWPRSPLRLGLRPRIPAMPMASLPLRLCLRTRFSIVATPDSLSQFMRHRGVESGSITDYWYVLYLISVYDRVETVPNFIKLFLRTK